MNCFPCFSSKKPDSNNQLPVVQAKEACVELFLPSPSPAHDKQKPSTDVRNKEADAAESTDNIAAKSFTFRELATATKNFRQECVIRDDGFGRVYKGTLQPSGQIVAVKQLDRNGMQGSKEFLSEVMMLSLLKHKNLLNLIGYCADGDQRILVYEHMPFGSFETHLLEKSSERPTLNWASRMKIALGAAEGLEYLHEKASPPIVYRDFKSSNILLDEEFNPRLCDFGLANLAQSGSKTGVVPARVMGTYGYSAPEYSRTGDLTLKSDIYSFGVVLLELISGRRAIDPNRPANEQNLVTWAQPIFKDPKRFLEMADPLLNLEFSVKSLNQAIGIAAMCLQEEPTVRPFIRDVVAALTFLTMDPKSETNPSTSDLPTPNPDFEISNESKWNEAGNNSDYSSSEEEDNVQTIDKEDKHLLSGNEHSRDHNDDDDGDDGDDDDDDKEEEDQETSTNKPDQIHKLRSQTIKVQLPEDGSMCSTGSRSSISTTSDD